ncbi:MAG: dUTP diphosphatase [Patescibacteria group bacterium]
MKVRIKRINKEVSLPEYKTPGAVAFDLSARETVNIPSHEVAYVSLNVCVDTPDGFMLFLAARSSLHKRGLMLANGVGIGDQDFCGNGDEYAAALYNFSDMPVAVQKDERIVQGMFLPISKGEWIEVDDMGMKDRGGYGSTGV